MTAGRLRSLAVRTPGRLRSLAPRLARLTAFLAVVALGLYFLLGRVVSAQVEGSLLELGAGIAQLAPPERRDGPRVLELNGAELRIAVTTRPETVEAVLSAAEKACSPGGDRDLQGRDGERGFVACFRAPVVAQPVVGETEEARPAYHYVYAQPGEDGTLVVSVAADAGLDLAALFPPEGDAPGFDAPGLPRPPGARRVLSAREPDAPQQMVVYMSPEGEPAELLAWYRASLPALGWRPLHAAEAAGEPQALVVERSGTLATLVVDDAPDGASVAILSAL